MFFSFHPAKITVDGSDILHQLIGPMIYQVLYIPGGAGVLPTVSPKKKHSTSVCNVKSYTRETTNMNYCFFLANWGPRICGTLVILIGRKSDPASASVDIEKRGQFATSFESRSFFFSSKVGKI